RAGQAGRPRDDRRRGTDVAPVPLLCIGRAGLRGRPVRHRLRRDPLGPARRAGDQRGCGGRRGARRHRPRSVPATAGRDRGPAVDPGGPRGHAALRYAVRAGDRELAIEVTPEGRFLVGDRAVAAELAEIVAGRLWSVVIDGDAHEVAFLGSDRVWVDGEEVRLDLVDERAIAAGRAGGRSADARQEIRAPMPGLLKRVHVSEGAAVSVGDALVTLEAMEMENELRAAHAGTIAQIA